MPSHCIHFAGQNSHCQSMTWPIMTMTRLRLIFPCIMCGKIISAQGLVIDHLKNIHVVLVLACMLCGNTLWCLSPRIEHITSVHVLPFQPSGRKLNLRLCPVPNGQAIGDATRPRDNLTKKVGPGATRGGQLTLKDDSDAKILKGPKIK